MKSSKQPKMKITLEQYREVERLLYNHNKIKKRIVFKSENINAIVIRNYKSFLDGLPRGTSMDLKSEIEKKEEFREKIIDEIADLGQKSKLINDSLVLIKEEKYYQIIELKYFKKNTIEDIAETLGIGTTTVKRITTYLIKLLAEIIFYRDNYITNRNIDTLKMLASKTD
ncbi:MAG: hypothetical protein LBT51_08010 [Fusobacteriaceae bacterium]|jgi:DNA-directed RNA polymerase specialized sigma subunit|nr:hypothetical protein [Fusobacteriaceae bacterium]